MRNLGLSLLLASFLLAPHVAEAKKKHGKKQGRTLKAMKAKPLKSKRARIERPAPPPRDDDQLATAVSETRRAPTMTSAAASPAPAPVLSNQPVNMANQVIDDEVPGKKKK